MMSKTSGKNEGSEPGRGLLERLAAGGPVARVQMFLGAAATGLVVYLLAAPKPWAIDDAVKVWAWGGGLVALCGVIFLLATAKLWAAPPGHVAATFATPATPRWFWPLVVAAMGVTALMGATRLHHDLWADEELTLRLFVQGGYKPDPKSSDSAVVFKEFGAGRAFHHYNIPNNHVLHSILARLSVSTWRVFRSPEGPPFSEAALRIPAYLFGIFSVAALALLLKECALPRAGIIAAFLLALHPWHIRYASEARGYSMLLTFLPLMVVFWMRAMRTNRWRDWTGFGAMQFCLIYTFPAAIYPVGTLAVITLLFFAVRALRGHPGPLAALRWFVSCVSGGILFVLLFAPCVPQFLEYLKSGSTSRGVMGRQWTAEFASYLFAGSSWFKSGDLAAPQPELKDYAASSPVMFFVLTGAAALFALAGATRLARRGALTSATMLALVVPGVFSYAAASVTGVYLFEWYLIYTLCGAVMLVAAGLDATGALWRGKSSEWVAPAVITAVFLAGYLDMTQGIRNWLLTKPLEQVERSVLLTRPTTLPNYPGHNDVITACFSQHPYLYDPHIVRLKTTDELVGLMRRSDAEGKPLYLNVGGIPAAHVFQPEMTQLLLSSPQFEIVARLPGWESYWDRIVARYVPGSLANGRRIP